MKREGNLKAQQAIGIVLHATGQCCWMVVLLLSLSGCGKKAVAPPVPPVPVTTAQAVIKSMPLLVEAMGSVEACNSLEIVPQVSG
ncbi:MAG: hypothetical protein NT167_02680, partial [Verrucomicrobia bacterium]|nr:hypothetical protein [Verrucomicrobiota bacterium]